MQRPAAGCGNVAQRGPGATDGPCPYTVVAGGGYFIGMTIVSQCRRWQAQVGQKRIGDAPIFYVPAMVIRLARLGQKLGVIGGNALVVRRMDVSSPGSLCESYAHERLKALHGLRKA